MRTSLLNEKGGVAVTVAAACHGLFRFCLILDSTSNRLSFDLLFPSFYCSWRRRAAFAVADYYVMCSYGIAGWLCTMCMYLELIMSDLLPTHTTHSWVSSRTESDRRLSIYLDTVWSA